MLKNDAQSEAEWLQRLQNHDEQALAAIIRKYYASLYNYAARFTQDDALIKDCIQEVFISLWQRRETAASILSPKYYLLRAVKNKVLKSLHQGDRKTTSIDNYDEPGFDGAKYVMTPPLREKSNQEELWKGLKMDDLQVISTDHCPFCMKEQKELGRDDFTKIPNGAPGVENRVPLIYNGGVVENRISLNRFVELTSTAAAKMFGLFPKKGTVAVGSDADIVIFDPEQEQTLSVKSQHMNCDYNAYEGKKIKGVVETVLSRGNVVIDKGEFKGKAGNGQFLKRGTCVAL